MKKYKIIENGIEYNIEEYLNKDIYWYYKVRLHRENGPALELSNGYKVWYKHGNRHREDGPAVINSNSREEYWLNGKYYENINSVDELLIANIIE